MFRAAERGTSNPPAHSRTNPEPKAPQQPPCLFVFPGGRCWLPDTGLGARPAPVPGSQGKNSPLPPAAWKGSWARLQGCEQSACHRDLGSVPAAAPCSCKVGWEPCALLTPASSSQKTQLCSTPGFPKPFSPVPALPFHRSSFPRALPAVSSCKETEINSLSPAGGAGRRGALRGRCSPPAPSQRWKFSPLSRERLSPAPGQVKLQPGHSWGSPGG